LAFIRQYINPNYQEGDYAAAASLSKELASTRQGTAGGTLYNAGTASQHLELLDEAAKALNNNDTSGIEPSRKYFRCRNRQIARRDIQSDC